MPQRTDGGSRAKLPAAAIHCIWIVSSFVVLACALVSLGVTCYLVGQTAGPCPRNLPLTLFAVSGGLLLLSSALLLRLCRKRRLKPHTVAALDGPSADCLGSVLDPLPVNGEDTLRIGDDVGSATINVSEELESAGFINDEKSADVSYWIDQQPPMEPECVPLEPQDGATDKDADNESVKSEITSM